MIHIDKACIPSELFNLPLVIYGGGHTGKTVIQLFMSKNCSINYIVDDNEDLHGQYINNIEIISYSQFVNWSKEYDSVNVVMTTIYGKKILQKLSSLSNIQIYELYDWYNREVGDDKYWYSQINVQMESYKIFKEHMETLQNKWEDEESITVIDRLMDYFNTKKTNALIEICTSDEQYFISEVKKAIKNPLNIIDAGAYQGELLQSLKNQNIDFVKWYCFEADNNNFNFLVHNSKKNGLYGTQQICINKGLWSKTGKLFFENGQGNQSRIVDHKTDDMISTVSIDDYMQGEKCDYIKMDIEGAELPALQGGIKTIKRDRPILAISIYHSLEDFWKIPEYLMKELTDYRYYVRHHTFMFVDTVLYAIPSEL